MPRSLSTILFTLLLVNLPLHAQERVRGFVSVEPFEFRLEAIVRVEAYREAWRMEGESIGAGQKQAVLDNLLTLFESGVKVSSPGLELDFSERIVRFVTLDAERGYVPDERESIPISEALVGLTFSDSVRGVSSFDLEWLWFPPGQDRLVLEIASRGKPSARLLTPAENRASWKLEGDSALPSLQALPGLKREERHPLRPLLLLGLAMAAVASVVVLRKQTKTPAWAFTLLLAGIALGGVALRYKSVEVVAPAGTESEDLVYALLRNVYHAFDYRDESAIYDTLEASVSGPLLERVYLEMRNSLELENAGGPRVRVYEIALRECEPVGGGLLADGGFRTRAEWVTIGEVTHWGHTHERTNRYEAEISLLAVEDTWKIDELALLNEERVQKTTRTNAATEENPTEP